jgi:predicted phage-related endonuclease
MSTGRKQNRERRQFVGGSDARIIMGDDEAALVRLWREKRGEAEPEDLSGNLVVQFGVATEELNRRWFEANAAQTVIDVQKRIWHPTLRWMAATLDGRVGCSGAVFESKFISFSEGRQMGRNQDSRRSTVPASDCHGRAKILAVC